MEETVRIHAIVLDRKPFREHDLLVMVYSQERGREQLIARGARKFRSKIAAHIEPFCFIDGLIVVGKNKNYLGSAISSNVFVGIKSNLDKLSVAGRVFMYLKATIRDREEDGELFEMLQDYLELLTDIEFNLDLIGNLFIYRLSCHFGYGLDVYNCGICRQKLVAGCNKFDAKTSKIVHETCGRGGLLTISDECVKVLRIANNGSFKKIANISIVSTSRAPYLVNEIEHVVATLVEKTQK